MEVAREVQRFSELLRLRIVASGLTQRAVERKLGWSAGYVSQLLRGNQDLKVKQVYAILDAIGVDADELMADMARARSSRPLGEVVSVLHSERGLRLEDVPVDELMTQLRPMVQEIVQETLARREQN